MRAKSGTQDSHKPQQTQVFLEARQAESVISPSAEFPGLIQVIGEWHFDGLPTSRPNDLVHQQD
jgi:hypothetical protein